MTGFPHSVMFSRPILGAWYQHVIPFISWWLNDWAFGWFPLWPSWIMLLWTICVLVFAWMCVFIFLGIYTSMTAIAGSCSNSSCLRNVWNVSPRQRLHFKFPLATYAGSVSPHPHQHFVVWLFDSSHFCGCEMASHYGFDLHFPKDWWFEHLFNCFWTCRSYSLERGLPYPLPVLELCLGAKAVYWRKRSIFSKWRWHHRTCTATKELQPHTCYKI